MKLRQSMTTIDAYVDGLRATDAGTVIDGLSALSAFLGEYPDKPMSTLVERGSQFDRSATAKSWSEGGLATIGQVTVQLHVVANVLASGGGKSDCIKDLRSLAEFLRQCAESDDTLKPVLDNLRVAMEPEPVDLRIGSFIERLKRETGTALFERTFAELTASNLKREHVVSVAKSVYGGIKNTTSRKGALAFIRKPHDARLSAKRGIEATGGRSAA